MMEVESGKRKSKPTEWWLAYQTSQKKEEENCRLGEEWHTIERARLSACLKSF